MQTDDHRHQEASPAQARLVLEAKGMQWATEQRIVECVLERVPGVSSVEVNPVAQVATVTFDTSVTSVGHLRSQIEDCGYRCAGESVPSRCCDPMEHADHAPAAAANGHAHQPTTGPSAHEMMGHGGHGAMSMEDMSPTCAGASWSPPCSRSRSCCGRRSGGTSWASTWPRRSGCATTSSCWP